MKDLLEWWATFCGFSAIIVLIWVITIGTLA